MPLRSNDMLKNSTSHWTCPNCGKNAFAEVELEHEFQFGRKNPVAIKAKAPVNQCLNCGCTLLDWRMEKEISLAVSVYLKEHHDGSVQPPEDLRIGHAASSRHKKQLEHEGEGSCFYCLGHFTLDKIVEWIDDGQTALCPLCGIDAVIPWGPFTGTSEEFLKRMQEFWFDAAKAV